MNDDIRQLAERIAKVERRQAMLQVVLCKDESLMHKHAVQAARENDAETIEAMIELGIVGVNDLVMSRTLLSIALRQQSGGETFSPAVAHRLLDLGADPLIQNTATESSSDALVCLEEPRSLDRFELLLRCEGQLRRDARYDTEALSATIFVRALLSGQRHKLEPRHLRFDQSLVLVYAQRDRKDGPFGRIKAGSDPYWSRIELTPLHFIAAHGDAKAFHDALELGLKQSSAKRDYYSSGAHYDVDRIGTREFLELLGEGKQQHRHIFEAHIARREAEAALGPSAPDAAKRAPE